MSDLERALTQTRNAMIKALLDLGVDPLVTGALMSHSERMDFYVRRLENRVIRLERRGSPDRKSRRPRKTAKLYVLPGCEGAPSEQPNPAA
jgi:hypothetical protein